MQHVTRNTPMVPNAIVLTGFMAVGKTTVGRRAAALLGYPFVDLDALIVQAAGKTVPELFAEGEAVFRWWEQYVLGRLDMTEPQVISTGGGTLIGAWNRARVSDALVIVLDASLDKIQERLSGGPERPLAAELATRYSQRHAIYHRFPHHVDTTNLSEDEVANQVVAIAKADIMTEATPPHERGETIMVVAPNTLYPVHVEWDVAAGIGGYVGALQPSSVAIITDTTVGRLWGESLRYDLLAARLPTVVIEVPTGEYYKRLETVMTVYDRLLDHGIDRQSVVVALGGGVIGDMAGFVAATWMRGVKGFIQVPTTLLAMVDASIGGKTGVDHPKGKNLIGAFRQPDMILTDPAFLSTLPPREWRSGMTEVIKHCIIADPDLFEQLRAAPPLTPADVKIEWLTRAIQVKTDIVERDPFERGERAKLNLGHTFGHAYEILSEFTLTHGEAVSIGIVTAARLSERLGLAEKGVAQTIESTLDAFGLPTAWDYAASPEDIWTMMQSDKKKAGAGLRFVLPRAIGDVVVTEPGAVAKEDVIAVLSA